MFAYYRLTYIWSEGKLRLEEYAAAMTASVVKAVVKFGERCKFYPKIICRHIWFCQI